MAEYEMVLSFNNRAEVFYFPVLPEKVELKKKGRGKTYDVVGLGQINVIKSRELAEISFECFFPAKTSFKYPFLSAPILEEQAKKLWPPQHYIDYINKWMESKHPVRFILAGKGSIGINLPVSIEQFDRWEEAGSPGDIYYRLTLKEYVLHSAQKVQVLTLPDGKKVTKKQPPKRPDMRVMPKTYTLQKGDNLQKVGRKFYDDSSRWREIKKYNGLTDAQLKALPVGMVIKLPAR